MTAVNLVIGVVLALVFGSGAPDSVTIFAFLVGLLSLITVLFDRFDLVAGDRRRYLAEAT
jgi:hypothetical protein